MLEAEVVQGVGAGAGCEWSLLRSRREGKVFGGDEVQAPRRQGRGTVISVHSEMPQTFQMERTGKRNGSWKAESQGAGVAIRLRPASMTGATVEFMSFKNGRFSSSLSCYFYPTSLIPPKGHLAGTDPVHPEDVELS